jgi:hypothetical protein
MAVNYRLGEADQFRTGLFNRKMISTSTSTEANFFHIARALKNEGISLNSQKFRV